MTFTFIRSIRESRSLLEKRPHRAAGTCLRCFEYDPQNRLGMSIDMSDPDRLLITTFQYDTRGHLTKKTDPEGRETKSEYDLRGNRVKETDAEGAVTTYTYDDADRLETLEDARGNVTTYHYDEHGNLFEEIRADGATWHWTYDPMDEVETTTDANGTVTTYGYDDAGRLRSKTMAGAPNVLGPSAITYTVDDLGRVTGTKTSEGVKTTATFDSLDRELTESQQIGEGPVRTVTHAFDPTGNLTGVTYPSGLALTRTIDPLGRIAAITESGKSAPIVMYADAGPRQVTRTLENGITSSWGWDVNARLASIRDIAAPSATGRVRAPALTARAERAQCSGLNDCRKGQASGSALRDLTYDRSPAGEKNAAVRADLARKWSYEHNRIGAITAETLWKTDTQTNPMLRRTSYDVDPVLNYRSITKIVQTPQTATTTVTPTSINTRNQYTSFGGETLGYDANGNLIRTAGAVLQYDAENHLAKATLADGTTLENLYDANGRKVEEVVTPAGQTPQTTEYVLDGDEVLEEYVAGTRSARYVRGRGIDEIVRAETASTTLYPLQDELGNVDRLTDASGATLERYEYEGYGRFHIFDASSTPRATSEYGWRWLFQGREYLPALDAYDFRARTLWVEMGRFGQEDPEGEIGMGYACGALW